MSMPAPYAVRRQALGILAHGLHSALAVYLTQVAVDARAQECKPLLPLPTDARSWGGTFPGRLDFLA